MNPRNRRKAKRVGEWLKVALYMIENEDFYFTTQGFRTYSVNSSRPLPRKDFVNVIEKNKKLLRELLK